MSSATTDKHELCLSPRGRAAVLALVFVYLAFQVGMNTVLRMARPGTLEWFSPPFAAWSLYAGGSPIQRAVEVTVTDGSGREAAVDLDDYFAYRLPHRPAICMPERCEALLREKPTWPHERLLDVVLREYNARHAAAPAVAGSAWLVTWNMDTQERSEGERTLVATRRIE